MNNLVHAGLGAAVISPPDAETILAFVVALVVTIIFLVAFGTSRE